MRIAVAADNGHVSLHFGRCQEYEVFEVEDGAGEQAEGQMKARKIAGRSTLKNPGHEPGLLPRLLSEHGVDLVIAGGMGPKAVSLLHERNIRVITGVVGPVEEVVRSFLDGTMKSGESTCDHDTEGHAQHDHKCK